jgi:hypothetical protein
LARCPGCSRTATSAPATIVHSGDDTVVLDWGTLGSAAVGSDSDYLALSTVADLGADYLAGLGQRNPDDSAVFGYRATLALVGTSRLYWMLIAGHPLPAGYFDFIWDNRPQS